MNPNENINQGLTIFDELEKRLTPLLKIPFFAKIGKEAMFAIACKSISLGIDPLDALNGGLYSVQGKVEMSANMMNQLIRKYGHSIKKDPKSDDTICILHGRRADNGDDWTESFSLMEAKRAGLVTPNNVWSKYPGDMLFARALSRLARRLFPDVIKGCYTEGEIKMLDSDKDKTTIDATPIGDNEIIELNNLIGDDEKLKKDVLKMASCEYYEQVTVAQFPGITRFIDAQIRAKKKSQLSGDKIGKAEFQNLMLLIGDDQKCLDKIYESYGIASVEELPVEKYGDLIVWVEKRIAKKQAKKDKESTHENN
jgi:uncharacterized protein YlaN (UPF0358 family)